MTVPVFILAGEPSGDQLAARIMDAVESRFGSQTWFGVGGPQMRERGFASEFEMAELSVVGFAAALSAYPRLSALADGLVDRIIEVRPSAVITVDAKGFSLRLAARLKKANGGNGLVGTSDPCCCTDGLGLGCMAGQIGGPRCG